LKIEFDRIGFPDSDIPMPSKIIAAKGYKVDKKGDIVGKGHATRDTVEWLIPPLWLWKVLTLPRRGPRPTLKGEEQITVRLMDDIDVPRQGASLRSYERPPAPASYHSQSFRMPVSLKNSEKPANDAPDISEIGYEATNAAPDGATTTNASATSEAPAQMVRTSSVVTGQPARVRLIALKSENVYAVTNYRINGGSLSYVLASGGTGSVDLTEVDWRATSRLNGEAVSAYQVTGTPTEWADRAEGHSAAASPDSEQRRLIGGNNGSDRLAGSDVCDDGSRAGVEHRGQNYRQNGNHQHRLLEADGTKSFGHRGGAACRAARWARKSLRRPVSRGPNEAPHIYMAMK